jgi:hypothetical protein
MMSQRIILLTEEDLKNIVKDTIEKFYDKIYQQRNELHLIPAKEEIIDRKELCHRLDITEPTVIRLEKKKKIPVMRLGSTIRYNWKAVVKQLEKNG